MKTIPQVLTVALLLAAGASAPAQPIITNQPLSATNLAGTTATFTVGAEGTPPLAYQWWFNNAGIPGLTNATLSFTNVQRAEAGNYDVVVTNSAGAVTSLVATLTVLTPPRFLVQPANQTASLFADATFHLSASGDGPLSYQWRFNNVDLPGMTSPTLTVTNVQRADAGNYYAVVTNSSGSTTSQVTTLTIVPFNSIYCFGFSWTDTRALSHGCSGIAACPACYWQGRYSNGPLWPEYLSTNLGIAYVPANNYAHCGATPQDVLNQVNSYPAPPKPELSLYCLFLTDNLITSNTVDHLYRKGARTILIEGQFDITYHGSFTNNLDEYRPFNAAFVESMREYSQTKPDVRILFVDLLSKFEEVLANLALYGFTKTNIDALDDTALLDKSFTGPGADYLFWDTAHVTTKLHKLMAEWHIETLTDSRLETLQPSVRSGLPTLQLNHLQIGRDYTLQSSSDLAQWNEVQTFTAAAGTNQWSGGSGEASAGFYRLKWQL